MDNNKKISTIDLLLIITTFVWGLNSPMIKIGLTYMNLSAFNVLRMTIGAVVCWLFYFFTKKENKMVKKDIIKIVLISFFGYFTMIYGFSKGSSFTTAGNATLIAALVPCFVAVINHFLQTEKITRKVIVGIILSLIGVFFISIGSGKEINIIGNHMFGIILVLISQMGVAIYTVFIKDLMNRYTPFQIFPILLSVTAILLSIVGYRDLAAISVANIPPMAWFSMIYTGVLVACLGHFVWAWGVKKIGSVRTSLYNNLPPVFGVIAGIVILNEHFGWLQFVGAVIIFTGLYITRTQKKLSDILYVFKNRVLSNKHIN